MADGGDPNDGLWMLFFIIAFICAIFFGIWFLFKPYILQGYIWARQGEMAIASVWTDADTRFETSAGPMTFGQARQALRTITPEILMRDDVKHWEFMEATSQAALRPLRIPIGIIFGILIYYAWFRSPEARYRKVYGLDTLIEAQARTFPVVAPFIKFNPINDAPHRSPGSLVPAKLPLFAEALSPEEWVAYHQIPVPDGKLEEQKAEEALKLQLYGRWKGYKALKPYQQVLLAAFVLKAARKRQEADDMLGELALCWNHKDGLRLSGALVSKARKILKNKEVAGETIAAANRHAYVTTALLGAIDYARSEGGVLAPAQFVWLRGHDRTLWYPLNNLGRQAFHAEAFGAMSHYRAEKLLKRPIPKPMLSDAVKVLTAYLGDRDRSMPIPQLDFSMIKNKKDANKNQGIMKPAGT
jgi:intracellular multiplication protein IcmP